MHELSDVITFLATPAAAYINGAIIPVYGGRTRHPERDEIPETALVVGRGPGIAASTRRQTVEGAGLRRCALI